MILDSDNDFFDIIYKNDTTKREIFNEFFDAFFWLDKKNNYIKLIENAAKYYDNDNINSYSKKLEKGKEKYFNVYF